MAGFKLTAFKGIRPRISAKLLNDGEAQVAENLRFGSGNLEPWKATLTDSANCNPGNIQTIYRFNNGGSPVWFEWTTDVDVVRGPVKNDILERTYFTGDGVPKMTFTTIATPGAPCAPAAARNLGIPAPSAAASVSGTPLSNAGQTSDGSLTVQTLTVQNVIWEWTAHPNSSGVNTYPGGCIESDWWQSQPNVGGMEFPLSEGTRMEVETVVDANNFTVKNPDGATVIVGGAVTKWQKEDTGSCVFQKAEVKLGIPNGLKINKTNHRLRVGDIIRVTNIINPLFFRETTQDKKYYEVGTWATPFEDFDGFFEGAPENTARRKLETEESVYNNATGTTDFAINGSFAYEIIRAASTIAEVDDRSYVYTYVSGLGEEGPPSEPSAPFDALDGDTISVSGLVAPPTSGYDITHINLYRSIATEDDADFLFVTQLTLPATSYNDSVANADVGEAISTTDWYPPPSGMKGLTGLPNGMMAGFTGKTVHFCEPYFPHAWPTDYDQAVDYDIVALGAFGNSLVILTDGQPAVATGSHPRNMNIRRVELNQACASKNSVAQLGDNVLYASPDGIVAAGVNGFRLVSGDFFTKREWQAYNPSSMVAEVQDGRYIVFYDTGSVQGNLVFNPTDPLIGLSTGTEVATNVYLDIESDDLFITDGSSITKWDSHASNKLTYTWKSKKLKAEYPMNLGAAVVDADAYPVTFKLYAGGKLRATRTVRSDEPFKLPDGYLESMFEIEVTGTSTIHKIHVAETEYELAPE